MLYYFRKLCINYIYLFKIYIDAYNMKKYTSMGTSPPTDYTRFNDGGNLLGGGGSGLQGGGGSAKNMRDENNGSHEKREIMQNSEKIINTHNLYSYENIIDGNSNLHMNASYVDTNKQTIVLPFYRCIIDLVILNDLHVDIVDNMNTGVKNKVLCSGKIRKYRFNGAIQNYDLFIEMMNENVFHVKKRGIMMRVNVSEDLRRLIINTMVNYVADGGDVVKEIKGNTNDGTVSGYDIIPKKQNKKTSWFKCFGF